MESLRKIELLAPAKNEETAIEAINCGADAVYMGASKFGARSSAGNNIESIARVVEYAHKFNAKVYVTVNTIIKDSEINDVENLIRELYDIKVDALIVQDMGILNMNIPPIQLHASTQCDIRTVEKAQFLCNSGFSQLVMARELTLAEISAIHKAVDVPLEAFIHGALCVSYSGRCHVSEALRGRSANRGECAQLCRLPYDLIDGNGKVLKTSKHLLSLKDLNQILSLRDMLSAGVSSFKIEGRLKDPSYVRNVVSKYREALDKIISENPDKYIRSSIGKSNPGFMPVLEKSFNRSFTNFFLHERRPMTTRMASFYTPKSMGEMIGVVQRVKGRTLIVDSKVELNNGDGISFINSQSQYDGFRINRSEGNEVHIFNPISIETGTKLYRTYDKKFEDILSSSKSRRTLALDLELKINGNEIILKAIDELDNSIEVKVDASIAKALKPQHESQLRVLSKLGDTHYELRNVITLDGIFIAASSLSQSRRDVVKKLMESQIANYKLPLRGTMKQSFQYPSKELTFADNVANSLAESFYLNHGVVKIERALEVTHDKNVINTQPLMTTRYCLRRELGCCKKTPEGANLQEPLRLQSNDVSLLLKFDCTNCEMKVYHHSQS